MSRSDAVERFLATGEHDAGFPAWDGSAEERREAGTASLMRILRRIVSWRSRQAPLEVGEPPPDADDRLRRRVEPMLRGLLPGEEAEALLPQIPDRVRVITVEGFVEGLGDDLPLYAQWALANLLLDAMGAPPLSDEAPQLDGFCAGGCAWLLPRALSDQDPRIDVVAHEVAHLLHELPRGEVGLAPPGLPILTVPAAQRETWAYGCEIWAWASRGAPSPHTLSERVDSAASGRAHEDARVDAPLLRALLQQALARPRAAWQILRDGVGATLPDAPAPTQNG